MQGARGAQGAGAQRGRVRHGPRRPRRLLGAVPERQQLGAGHRRVHAGGHRRRRLGAHGRHHRRGAAHGQGPRPVAPDRRRRRGSAPTPASSSTRRSTAGTPLPTPGESTPATLASSIFTSTTSACNLASINLLEFLDDDRFDVDAFRHTVEMVFTAQEILVGRADYPTEKIAENAHDFRQLGLGYTNLGALLMALGLPYDSAAGRAWAAAITSLMTGHAYATSARTAARMGPFAGFAANEEHMLRVLRMHRDASERIEGIDAVPAYVVRAAQEAWETAVRDGEEHGVRNSQATRPGTDRHDFVHARLRHDRRRARPRPRQVEEARRRRDDVDRQPDGAAGAAPPRLRRRPDRRHRRLHRRREVDRRRAAPVARAPAGVRLLDGRQHDPLRGPRPHAGGGAAVPQRAPSSKTTNMPEDVTVEEVEHLHQLAWELGLKSIAIYRDNCKVGQPLSTTKKAVERTARRADHVVAESGRRRSSSGSSRRSSIARCARSCRAAAGAHVRVPRRRLQGLRHDRRVRRRPPGRGLPHRVEAGLDAGRDHGRLRQVDLLRPAVRRAVAGVRRGVHEHALRTGRDDRRSRDPLRLLGDGLPVPQAGDGVHDVRRAGRAVDLLGQRADAADVAGPGGDRRRDQLGFRDGRRPEVAAVGRRPRRPAQRRCRRAGADRQHAGGGCASASPTPRCACSAAWR